MAPAWHVASAALLRGLGDRLCRIWDCAFPSKAATSPNGNQNLAGEIVGNGARNYQDPIQFDRADLPGGFLTWGVSRHCSEFFPNEGDTNPLEMAEQFTAVAALPDDRTMLVIQRCSSLVTERVKSVKGLHLLIQNDLYNDSRRSYRHTAGKDETRGGDSGISLCRDIPGNWINVDERIGLVTAWSRDAWTLNQPGRRQIGIKPYPHIDSRPAKGNLCADEICSPHREGEIWLEQGELLFDLGAAVLAGTDSEETESVAANDINYLQLTDTVRVLFCRAADGNRYALAANSGLEAFEWQCSEPVEQSWGETGNGDSILLKPQSAVLFKLKA